MRKAAIDVGSNSVLLLVEEQRSDEWFPVYEDGAVTSLGAGTKATGKLSEEAMERTLAVLREFFELARQHGAEHIEAAATMAARIATNSKEFQIRAATQGTPVAILSGEDEAQLGFDSVTKDPAFRDEERISIVDVGGHSTEVVTGTREGDSWQVLFKRSFPIGTLALKAGLLKEECPRTPEILAAVVELDEAIGLCYRRGMCGTTVALGATGTNLVTIRDQIAEWDPLKVHGKYLNFGEISEEGGRLMKMREQARAQLIGMEKGREATLPAGALILERVLNAIGAAGTFVSTRGWRHALLEHGLPS